MFNRVFAVRYARLDSEEEKARAHPRYEYIQQIHLHIQHIEEEKKLSKQSSTLTNSASFTSSHLQTLYTFHFLLKKRKLALLNEPTKKIRKSRVQHK